MKSTISRFVGLTFLLTTLACVSSFAQEGIPNNEIPDLNFYPELKDEKPLLFEPEKSSTTNERATQGKEQFISTPKSSKPKSVGEGSKGAITKPEDDALSFNFLYYIIQKFKISDIVEQ